MTSASRAPVSRWYASVTRMIVSTRFGKQPQHRPLLFIVWRTFAGTISCHGSSSSISRIVSSISLNVMTLQEQTSIFPKPFGAFNACRSRTCTRSLRPRKSPPETVPPERGTGFGRIRWNGFKAQTSRTLCDACTKQRRGRPVNINLKKLLMLSRMRQFCRVPWLQCLTSCPLG